MKINQLRYFMAVCKHLNFSKAAEEMFVAQPTISAAVKDLEEKFGITLVHRLGYGVSLTAEGRQFAQMAKDLLDQVQTVEENMAELGNNRKLVRVGIPPVTTALWFPEIYTGFKQLYPDIAKALDISDWRAVEHSIRKAIFSAWQQRDDVVWSKYFPQDRQTQSLPPSNKQFISRLTQMLLDEMSR